MFFTTHRERLRYRLCHKISPATCSRIFYRKQKVVPNLIISLTTTPERIKYIGPTLNSFFTQTVLPEKIILNLPNKYRGKTSYHIPEFLSLLPLIEIYRCEKDWGPATKFLPTIKRYLGKKYKIVVLDDDQIYSRQLLKNYLKKSLLYPNHVLCQVGWIAPFNHKHDFRFSLAAGTGRLKGKATIDRDQKVDVIQGASSYLIQPDFFDTEFLNEETMPKEALFADDIWISGYLASRGIPRIVVTQPHRYIRLVNKHMPQDGSLSTNENLDHSNSNALYKQYSDYWTSFRHLVITRFNWPHVHSHLSKNGERVQTAEWLEHRFDLFEKYCLPSVMKQSNLNFMWIVAFNSKTPPKYKARIKGYKKDFENFVPVFGDGSKPFEEFLVDYIQSQSFPEKYIITTRLDNDDIIHHRFVQWIQWNFEAKNQWVINMARGYQMSVDNNLMTVQKYFKNLGQFISVVFKTPMQETVYNRMHNDWKNRNSGVTTIQRESWIELSHQYNLANDLKENLFETHLNPRSFNLPETLTHRHSRLKITLNRLSIRIFGIKKQQVRNSK